MKKTILTALLLVSFLGINAMAADAEDDQADSAPLSLITETPEEGFQLAIRLARKGVTETQPDRDVLFTQSEIQATFAASFRLD